MNHCKKNARKKRAGAALMLAIILGIMSVMMMISMTSLSESNTRQVVNDSMGKVAYYAAEAGLAEVQNFFNASFLNWGMALTETDLPNNASPVILLNDAAYWVEDITYVDDSKTAVVDVIGEFEGASRKIRARINTSIPKYFDDYGLLTDGVLSITGAHILKMSVHANEGLILRGPTQLENDAVATQSSDPDADAPDPDENPIGGYVDPIDVPTVPINDLRTITQSGLVLDLAQADLQTQIANAPESSFIYIGNPSNHSTKQLEITGDMQGKVIFIDDDVEVNANGIQYLSNVMIISSGILTVNGSVDFRSSHPGEIDTVFASQGNMTLNGSSIFESLFWTNGSFRQNGSSIAGRVISQNGITFHGSFILNSSNKLYDFGTFDNVASISSWQQISMDD